MKIAVQIFGHLRTYKVCAKPLYKHLIDKYDCDVFMHTWTRLDHNTTTWHRKSSPGSRVSVENKKHELEKLYNLKGLILEEQVPKDLGKIITIQKKISKEISIFGINSMIHSMNESNRLREEYQKKTVTKYDFIVSLRPDILLKKDFDLNKFLECRTKDEIKNTLFTAGFPMVGVWSDIKYCGATDLLFFAQPNVMTEFFENKQKFLNMIKPNLTINYGPEYYFVKIFEDLGFKTILIRYNLDREFEMLRLNNPKIICKKILKLHLRKKGLDIYVCTFLQFPIIRLRLNLFYYPIDICLGKLED